MSNDQKVKRTRRTSPPKQRRNRTDRQRERREYFEKVLASIHLGPEAVELDVRR